MLDCRRGWRTSHTTLRWVRLQIGMATAYRVGVADARAGEQTGARRVGWRADKRVCVFLGSPRTARKSEDRY